jgi:hypothetical protein
VKGNHVEVDEDDWHISVRTDDCRFTLEMSGEIVFRDDERGIASMGPRARFFAEEGRRGIRRSLEAEADTDGEPLFIW